MPVYPHIVDVWVGRHPQSKANVEEIHYGNHVRLSPVGEQQIEFMRRRILSLNIDAVVTSEARRAMEAVQAMDLHLPIFPCTELVERRRPSETIGKWSYDPPVRKILDTILANYGPGYQYSDEETWEESNKIIENTLMYLMELGRTGFRRIFVMTHGWRARMLFVRAFEGRFDPESFRRSYARTGFPNTALMHMWYGPEYNNATQLSWQVDIADVSHLPPDLVT
ncbi:MAG: hypothetical protein JWO84_591 [Parcubacteria group bacterium]|nr:hypothetical protein [Parcubacteria group bacterium]